MPKLNVKQDKSPLCSGDERNYLNRTRDGELDCILSGPALIKSIVGCFTPISNQNLPVYILRRQ